MKKERVSFTIIFVLFFTILIMFSFGKIYKLLDDYMVYIFLISSFMLLLLNTNKKFYKNYNILLVFILFCFMIITVLLFSSGVGSFLCILNFIILLYLSKYIFLKKTNIKYIYLLIIAFFIIIGYISFSVWDKYINGIKVINPNTIASIVLYLVVMLCVILYKHNIVYKNLIIIVLCGLALVFINNCNCRNAMLALAVFLLLCFIPKMKDFVNSHISLILWGVVFLGIIITVLYSKKYFTEIGFLTNLSSKNLYSGRNIIWKAMIDELLTKKYSFLFGLGSHNITNIGLINNYHTWYLGIVYMYGIPSFLLYFYYLISTIKKLNNKVIKLGFVAIFITGIFETTAIWIYVQFFIFILLLLDNKTIEEEEL